MRAGSTGLPPGFAVPVHRALTEHILLGGAPRGLAIANATLAGAIGLGLQLWIAGIAFLALGHMAAMWAARRDPHALLGAEALHPRWMPFLSEAWDVARHWRSS